MRASANPSFRGMKLLRNSAAPHVRALRAGSRHLECPRKTLPTHHTTARAMKLRRPRLRTRAACARRYSNIKAPRRWRSPMASPFWIAVLTSTSTSTSAEFGHNLSHAKRSANFTVPRLKRWPPNDAQAFSCRSRTWASPAPPWASIGRFIIRSIAGPPVLRKRQTSRAARARKIILRMVV